MKRSTLLPLLALAGGAVGFVLRRKELAVAYDPVTNLMHMDHPVSWLLIALAAALAAVFARYCRALPKAGDAPEEWIRKRRPGDLAVVLAAAVMLAAAGLVGMEEVRALWWADTPMLMAVYILCLPAALCAAAAGVLAYLGRGGQLRSVLLALPALTMLCWLVVSYQQQSAQPELQCMAWQILADVAIVLALYGQSGLPLGRVRPGNVCLAGLLAVFLSAVSLADMHSRSYRMLYLFAIVYLTAQTGMMLAAADTMPPAEEKAGDNTNEG